jgi:hypothetical protein
MLFEVCIDKLKAVIEIEFERVEPVLAFFIGCPACID